jgi:trehalose 2-sulfotransferase
VKGDLHLFPGGKPMAGYIICATPRTGSTLLCALLRAAGVAGWPESWFRAQSMGEFAADWGIVGPGPGFDWDVYFARARVAAEHGGPVAGLRIMWPTMPELIARGVDVARIFGPMRLIHLTRGDEAGQAVSRLRAEMTGTWHLGFEESDRPGAECYDFDRLLHWRDETRAHNRKWEQWFAKVGQAPIRLTYEGLAANPGGTARQLLADLGLDLPAGRDLAVGNRRMADVVSADWAARFRADLAARGLG